MRAVAFMFARNEERVLERTLSHLVSQGLSVCFVDHGSTDGTVDIVRSFRGNGVERIVSEPYDGVYDRACLLRRVEELVRETDADWCLFQDADEIREPPAPYQTLVEAFEAVGQEGHNAVHFDEFVFLPTSNEESFEGTDFVETMRYYYYFTPWPLHRVQAWKRAAAPDLDLVLRGGHRVEFQERSITPTPFVLRHYIALSREHLLAKYTGRVHAVGNMPRWHGARPFVDPARVRLPSRRQLKRREPGSPWDRTEPRTRHEFLGEKPEAPARRVTPGEGNEAPVPFIVGVSRSGTTLLRLMLDAHSQLAIPPETHFLPALHTLEGDGRVLRERFLQRLLGVHTWPEFQLVEEALREAIEAIEPFSLSAGLRAFYRAYADRFGKTRFGDKTPRYVNSMTLIQELLPEARFIHLIRDGRDVALSLREKTWFGPGPDLVDQAGHWAACIRTARQQAQELPHYIEVRYEDLVRDPPAVLRQICEFNELSYEHEMADPSRRASERLSELGDREYPGRRQSVPRELLLQCHSSVLQPPHAGKIGRWRTVMSADERRAFESVGGTVLRDLGYETPPLKESHDATVLRQRLEEAHRRLEEHRDSLTTLERRLFESHCQTRERDATIADLRRRIDQLQDRSDLL